MSVSSIKYRSCYLIDNDQDDLDFFVAALKEIEPAILCQVNEDPVKALVHLKAMPEKPEVIFLDINMPKMNGFEVLAKLKEDGSLRTAPVILYSTTNDQKQVIKGQTLGAHGFVTKTSSNPELCMVLKQIFIVS